MSGEEVYVLPASFGQRRLWFLDQLDPGDPAYNLPAAIHVRGSIDLEALRRSLVDIVARHETLRTTFALVDGEPAQLVAEAIDLPFRLVELDGMAAAERLIAEEAARPFDLARGPLFRTVVGRLAGDEHVVVLTMHHIVSDAWSRGVFVAELAHLYPGHVAGRPVPLPELPIQYGDYAAWQRDWLSGDVLEAQRAFWREYLAGAPELIQLPADRPRPALPEYLAGRVSFPIPVAMADGLRELGRRQGATLFMTLLAGFAALLHRSSGQDELVVGTPVANRNRKELEGLIGFLVNTLPLRLDLSGDPTFEEVVARVRDSSRPAYANQDLPLDQIVEALHLQRTLSHNPLFQVLFVYHNTPAVELKLAGATMTPLPAETVRAQVDLTLTIDDEPGGALTATLEYARDLFEHETVERLARRLRMLLEGALADPGVRVWDLPLLGEDERERLDAWGRGAELPVRDACLHELFEAQVARTPDREAVVAAEGSLTYGELNERANELAARLRALGVGPEVLVGICLERSLELVVSILAVLKAGGAYVPLDPAYPRARLDHIVEDSGCRLVLDGALPAPAGGGSGWRPPRPANPAYLIYTSGSTGRPKGVMIEHRGAAALVRWAADHFGPDLLAGTLAATSVCFDLSIFELFAPWSAGGTVILAGSVLDLPDLPAAGRVTLVNTVPSAMRELLRLGDLPAGVRAVNLAGEPLPVQLVEELHRRSPGLVVTDLYGPSETTTYSTGTERRPGDPATIGTPIANTTVHVLDRRLRPVPPGVPGELHIGGAGVARGYWRRPDLTAERFLPALDGGRTYRTGDLVRHLPDGRLEFLGRLDHQVKVRGFRIELGEIEECLLQHQAVDEAVAVALDGALVAYVTPSTAPDPAELRAFLAGRLPGHMVPTAIVRLDALPRTPSGKADRARLPRPAAPRAGSEHVAPRGEVEAALAAIWAEVLGADRVGVEDDFFELGGHSLLATRMVARAREALGVELPLRAVFEHRTVAGLAARVTAAAAARPLERVPRQGRLAPSYAQRRLWFLDQLEPGNPAYNVPMALRLVGPLDVRALERSVRQVVRRHEVLRARFVEADGGPAVEIAPDLEPRWAVHDLTALGPAEREAEAARLLAEEARRPFDLAAGPLLRCVRIALSGAEHLVLVNVHHIVTDGWSNGVLAGEVAACYAGAGPTGEPPVQYADYAAWQRAALGEGALERELAYWRERLAGAPPLLELPWDRPRTARPTGAGGSVELRVPGDVTGRLGAVARAGGGTLFMVLLAAFQVLLHRYSGQGEVVVGTPVANRERPELEGLIGLFVNTLALRADLRGNPPFAALLARVRETVLGAFDHQGVPFDLVVERLQPERSLSHTPVFQVMLALQNLPPAALELPGLRAVPVELEPVAAKFDLTLTLTETADGLAGHLEYARDLFDRATVERMARHLLTLLRAVASDQARPIDDVPLLDGADLALFDAWNATAPAPEPGLLHELFEAQAARTPDRQAVTHRGRALTYAELDERSNDLAARLRGLGVGPEVLVGVCLERSLELPVAILAVLKAGGAYVPLDPAYPPDRIAYIEKDSGCELVLDGSPLPDPSSPGRGSPRPDNLAYVIYTSGSTGRPKGVAIQHRSAAAFVRWAAGQFGPEALAGTLAATSVCFDLSIFELFAPWSAGGTVILAGSVLDLPMLPEANRVTLVNTVPSAVQELIGLAELPPGVRTVNLAGEPLSTRLVGQIFERSRVRRIFDLYGPSETTTYSTFTARQPAEPASIGRPIAATKAYVLDAALRRVPPGVAGELHIGGVGLARGYLGRPGLTAGRFLPDPFSSEAGARMYRTGDQVRHRGDGRLEYLGRLDQQVKVRGFRIELGEVEAALAAHPAVADAAVVARGDRLVAYHTSEAEPAELREHLRRRLPEHMVPSRFERLAELPRTANGKLDRRALPEPASGGAAGARTEPADATELRMQRIWEDTLGVEPIGVDDDFFELGGHSLLAVRLMARVREAWRRDVPLAALFEAPTVAALVALLRDRAAVAPPGLLVPIRPAGDRPPLFLVHPGGGGVLCYAGLARALGPDQPCYALRASGLEAGEPRLRTVEGMAQRYLEEVRAVRPHGPYVLAGWSTGGMVAYEMARRDGDAALVALLDTAASLPAWDESAGPALYEQLGLAGGSYEVFRSNLIASARYAPAGAARCPAVVLRAAESTTPVEGWERLGAETLAVPGDHLTMLQAPHVTVLAGRLAARIDAVRSGPPLSRIAEDR